MAGIVTALHAVLGCRNIVAISDDDGIFTDLTLSKVDISHDIALLETEKLLSGQPDGFVTISPSETFEYDQLYVIGYPLGVLKQRPSLDIQVINIATLGDLLPDAYLQFFAVRDSPSLSTKVLNLQGLIAPGHSGAPLIDKTERVVGVINGGLEEGKVGISWAMPWIDIQWEQLDTQKLRELEKKQSVLF